MIIKKLRQFNKPNNLFTQLSENEKNFIEYHQKQPLDLEIGAGVGLFAIKYSLENPKRGLIAIEKTKEKFSKLSRRFDNHKKPSNLLVVHSDALTWCIENLVDGAINRCFVLYPNPYPKSSDLNKRFYAMPLFGEFLKKINQNGEIFLASNEKFYIDESKVYFKQEFGLTLIKEEVFHISKDPIFLPKTHFEKKYFLRGDYCHHLTFKF